MKMRREKHRQPPRRRERNHRRQSSPRYESKVIFIILIIIEISIPVPNLISMSTNISESLVETRLRASLTIHGW